MTDWRHVDIVRTMLPLLIALSAIELVSGAVLETFRGVYLERPTLLVLLPVTIGMGGNLGALMSSRLSTGLHLGTVRLSPTDPGVLTNVVAVFGLAATVFAALGIAGTAVGRLAGGTMPLATAIAVTLASGLALAAVVILVSLTVTWLAYRRGVDPDDVVVPVVTNVCDVSGILILTAIATVLL